ncbi:MAG TPA: serine/threonine-protein kinase [Polyangiaceae bacterium]|nr:serine/threonine-protein kinase [Polyangiaceae bacterium]
MFRSPSEQREGQSFADEGGALESLGKYRIFARLGRGGMADVFLAVADGLLGVNKLAVLKRLRDNDDAFVQMFVDEARLAAQLNHPNIVHTYEAGASPAGYYIAMEYLDGQPLNAVMSRARKMGHELPIALGLHVICEALRGLHYAHELTDYSGAPLNIVHRDVSPHNIFLTYAGDVKLVDFGIAKALSNSTVTATGVIKGKVRYMAPEQARGATDRRSDLFAVGVVLWELATGERLFKGDEVQALTALLGAPIPSASSARPGLDPALEAVIARALEKDPSRRYQTAEQMRDELLACLPRDQAAGAVVVRRELDELFAGVREESRRRVQACLSRPRPGSTGLTPVAPGVLYEYDGLPDLWHRVTETTDSVPRSVAIQSIRPSGPPSIPPGGLGPRWSRIGTIAAVGLLGAAALATLFVVLKAPGTDKQAGVMVMVPTPSAPAHPPDGPVRVSKFAFTLETEPSGAHVSLGGKPLGSSPVRVDLERVGHTFLVTKEGFQTQEVVVDAGREAGESGSRVVRLQPRARAEEPRVTTRRYVPPPTPPRRSVAAPAGAEGRAPGTATISTPAPSAARVRAITDEDATKDKVKVVTD